MRLSRKNTLNWHFYNPNQDCKDGDCLVEAIRKNISILENSSEKTGNRAEALKFIVHLIGDLHQPLHCADNNDDYGNKVKVTFNGQHTNLHAVWDSYLIDYPKLSVSDYAEQLSNSKSAQNDYLYTRGTINDWALESNSLAGRAYEFDRQTGNLDDDYYRDNRPIIDTQLLKGGIRLAKILNDIFQEAKS
jgi:S1/P1 Nuclease